MPLWIGRVRGGCGARALPCRLPAACVSTNFLVSSPATAPLLSVRAAPFPVPAAAHTASASLRCVTTSASHVAADAQPAQPAHTFTSLGVSPFWVRRLAALGITQPTHTQSAALPHLLAGESALLKAATGTGKTLAYLIPALDIIRRRCFRDAASDGALRCVLGEEEELSPLAIVLVPTQELVMQVLSVARALLPEADALMKPAVRNIGLHRRDRAALLVCTPAALKENVNYRHARAPRMLVLDEADALLSGTYFGPTQSAALGVAKQLMKDEAPQIVFVAATLPAVGKHSVAAYLDKYYPASEVRRIVTTDAHRAVPRVEHRFVQIDVAAQLPASMARAQAHFRAQLAAAAEEALIPSSVLARQRAEARASEDDAAAAAAPDRVAASMAARAEEDLMADEAASEAAYAARVSELRKHALVHVLATSAADALRARGAAVASDAPPLTQTQARSATTPTGVSASTAAATAAATATASTVAAAPVSKRKARRAGELDMLIHASAARQPAAPPAAAADAPVAEEGVGEGDAGGDVLGADGIERFRPSHVTRLKLSAEEAGALPATLIFVNSADAAEEVRKFLLTACPGVRIAALHGRVDDDVRARTLAELAAGEVRVCVATDVAARGVDTLAIAHVIQADFSLDAVSFLHRVGRTARAGRTGHVTHLLQTGNLPLARALMSALAAGEPIDAAFSRKRSFRRNEKKAALEREKEKVILASLEAEVEAAAQPPSDAATV